MKVVILCGGKGTRLREETEFRPKPMVEVGGRPILWHVMKSYAYYGFHDFILCLGYKGDVIKDYFLDYEAMNNDFTIKLGSKHQITYHELHDEQNFTVTLADTGADTMTGGRLKHIEKYVDTENFLVTYGDGLCNVNIGDVVKFHKSHGRIGTLTTVQPASRFGIIKTRAEGQVSKFSEKPKVEGWINAGYFVFERSIFDYLGGEDCILEQQPLNKLAHDEQLMAYQHDGFFFAMDTYREYLYLNDLWNRNEAPWKVWP
jgi:glucose-1-phosphate cytidylyltransferase